MRTYRVDRMEGVSPMVDMEKADPMLKQMYARQGKEQFDAIDKSLYTNYTFSMYSGEVQKVTMIFANSLMNAVIDRFGKDLFFTVEDSHHFRVTVPVAVSEQFYGWIAGLGPSVTIVHPENVGKGYQEHLQKIMKHYERQNKKA